MTQVRIRFITRDEKSPWVYIQEEIRQETPKANAFQVKAEPVTRRNSKTNQYGRFRYSEMQYGRIEAILASALEISKSPIRIRNQNGEWIYIQQTTIDGACPSIRIRNRNSEQVGPWVYIQHKEV
ncbi:hypothetical protein P4493_10955 [Bacillus thuringiensis]|uniref:Uncharacterized protein n=4 Tax=Bacillus thuringiensis TaxID=1428 RepID=A0AB35PB62_BACTU|nr:MULTISPECIES: hypothetical protein [Bacillus]EAO57386.1 hypothetical protein RBTH_07664 [Bacillus thuringiensis serovar israelensis ATCC 35646]MEC3434411.1 hypothetical protein [Bacillus cereus]AFQ30222.1 hypothetical protein BTF1_30607 [Bacillus thuringiensis HD-789]AJH02570.1 hypothetical protein AS86_6730 [Bacillus thuringiensis HD1002]AND28414.1 hypothetical protein ATN07_32305 [Bacillus thuringiensis serovar israelensis]